MQATKIKKEKNSPRKEFDQKFFNLPEKKKTPNEDSKNELDYPTHASRTKGFIS